MYYHVCTQSPNVSFNYTASFPSSSTNVGILNYYGLKPTYNTYFKELRNFLPHCISQNLTETKHSLRYYAEYSVTVFSFEKRNTRLGILREPKKSNAENDLKSAMCCPRLVATFNLRTRREIPTKPGG